MQRAAMPAHRQRLVAQAMPVRQHRMSRARSASATTTRAANGCSGGRAARNGSANSVWLARSGPSRASPTGRHPAHGPEGARAEIRLVFPRLHLERRQRFAQWRKTSGSRSRTSVRIIPSRKRPASGSRRSLATASIVPPRPRRRAWPMSCSHANVAATLCSPARTAPRRAPPSSFRSCTDSVGWLIPQDVAAPPECPCSATAQHVAKIPQVHPARPTPIPSTTPIAPVEPRASLYQRDAGEACYPPRDQSRERAPGLNALALSRRPPESAYRRLARPGPAACWRLIIIPVMKPNSS